MIKSTNTKYIVLGAVLLIILMAGIMVYFHRETEANTSSDGTVTESIAIEQEGNELRKSLGANSAYSQFYVGVKLKIVSGMDRKQAAKETADRLIEDKALQLYARKCGISVSDKELQDTMSKIITDTETADNREEIDQYCKAAGVSFEDLVKNNENYYRMTCLRDKLYDTLIDAETDTLLKNEEAEETKRKNDEKWESFVKNQVDAYKKTSEYTVLKSFLAKAMEETDRGGTMKKNLSTDKIAFDIGFYN